MTHKALGRSIGWSINASKSNIGKIQRAQNEVLRIITGSHKMSSIKNIHSETEMLRVEDHLNLLSAQYLVPGVDTEIVCHHITKMDEPPREMKETIFTRHKQTVLPLLANSKKDTLQAIHTSFVNRAIDNMRDNRVLNNRPPPINDEETSFPETVNSGIPTKRDRSKLTLQSCPDCGIDPHDVHHLVNCMDHPTDLSPVNLWDKPVKTIGELSFLELDNLD